MKRILYRRADERGAVMVLAGVGIILAMIAAALAVDLGRLASDKRTDQKIADLAALDASRNMANSATACSAAQISAGRNGYTTLTCGDVRLGYLDATGFHPGGAMDAVEVEIRSDFDAAFPFVGGPSSTGAKAVAKKRSDAAFSIGSAVARIDTTFSAGQIGTVNRIMERLLGASSGSLTIDAVGYQGISDASVTLGELASEMGFGTVDGLLNAQVKLLDLFDATSQVLQNNGVAAFAEVDDFVTLLATSTVKVKLADMIALDQGAGTAALAGKVNVFQLISGSAQLANKNTFISVPDALVDVPVAGVGNVGTSLGLKVIEPPKIYIGPAGGSVTTSQVETTFSPTIDVQVNLNSLLSGLYVPVPLTRAVGTLPTKVTAAGATGTLTTVRCGAPQGIDVTVDTESISTSAASTLDLRLLNNVSVATINVEGNAVGGNPPSSLLSFAYPTEFSPPADSKTTPAPAAVPVNMTSSQTGTTSILGNTFSVSAVSNLVLDAIVPIVNKIKLQLASNEFAALGINLGATDVAALSAFFNPTTCGQPGLVR